MFIDSKNRYVLNASIITTGNDGLITITETSVTVSDIVPNQFFFLSVGAVNAAASGAGTSNPSSGEGKRLFFFLAIICNYWLVMLLCLIKLCGCFSALDLQ